MLKKILTSPWTALLTVFVVVAIRVADPVFVESVRLRYFDTLTTSRTVEEMAIHTINIDEAALEKYGQFPFSRDIYAQIIRDLYKRNAGLVVFNILTPDRDRFGRDSAYADALKQYPTVLPNLGSAKTRNQPRVPGSVIIGPFGLDAFVTYPGIIANVPQIENSAAGVGIVNTLPEVDGVVRRMPMIVAHDGRLYPSLAMEALRVASADSTVQIKINELGVEKMRIPKFGPVATDSLSRVWIDWSLTPQKHSLTNLPRDFEGDVVIVGVSAAGLVNPIATPQGEMWPQDLQATVIGTVVSGKNIQRPDWADGAEILGFTALTILLLFLTRWTYVGIGAGVVIVGSLLLLGPWTYSNFSWLLDITFVVCGIVLVLLHAYTVKFVTEFLQKQQIKRQFGTYLSPAMVERLQKNPELLTLGGESREL